MARIGGLQAGASAEMAVVLGRFPCLQSKSTGVGKVVVGEKEAERPVVVGHGSSCLALEVEQWNGPWSDRARAPDRRLVHVVI